MKTRATLITAILLAALFAAIAPATASSYGNSNDNGGGQTGALTIYFTRHAEKQTTLTPVGEMASIYTTDASGNFDSLGGTSALGNRLDEACGTKKCAEELSAKGLLRADLLAEYFDRKGVTDKLDLVVATHKTRTQQTVAPTAAAAELSIVTVPALGTELSPEGTTDSECPTIGAIFQAKADGLDTMLVAGHSGTLYDIMGDGNDECEGLGLNTDDLDRFPTKDGKVANFGDVWKVKIKRNGDIKFISRVNLQPVRLAVTEQER